MGEDPVLFAVSSKSRMDAKDIYSRTASLQFILAGDLDDLLQLSENISLRGREIMLILSSTLPFDVSHVSGGSGSCLILGHLSQESIECLMKMCGVRHQPNPGGMHKVVLQPEHRQLPITRKTSLHQN